MKKAILLITIIFISFKVAAQEKPAAVKGNGNLVKEKRQIPAFDKINVFGPFEVSLISGKPGAIILTGEQNILGLIKTEVKNNVLTIAALNGQQFKTSRNNKISIKVPFEILNEITLKGAATVNTKKTVTSSIKISLDDPCKVKCAVESETTRAHVSGLAKTKAKEAIKAKCLS
ncbi:MAG: hypothetical protein EOO95_09445 [Pedobacter sp.]|nr:MAG: hypothetical protein EOO95_09445 [Pedobacter sp.]